MDIRGVRARRATFMDSLIATVKLNGINPQAWCADVITRISGLSVSWLLGLLPWNGKSAAPQVKVA